MTDQIQLIPREPISAQQHTSSPWMRNTLIAVFCVLVLCAGVAFMYRDVLLPLIGVGGRSEVTPIDVVYDPTKQSTAERVAQDVEILTQKIDSATTEWEKLNYILQKGYMLVVNRVEKPELEAKREARKLFTVVYESTKGNPEYQRLNDLAVWGYIFQFAENCFGGVAVGAAQEIRDTYFTYFNNDDYLQKTFHVNQKEMFEGILLLIDDQSRFTTIRTDKVFNSYAAMIRASYLDAYRDELPPERTAELVEALKRDISNYENATYIMEDGAKGSMRTTLLAPMHLAFARFALAQATDGEDAGIKEFDTVYEYATQVAFKDEVGRSIAISWIKLYKLGALNRIPHTEEDIAREVSVLRGELAKNPQIISVIQSTLNYALSERGEWIDIRQDVFALAKTSPSLATFLEDIGIKDY